MEEAEEAPEIEAIEQEKKVKHLVEVKAGDQTKKEVGVHSWKIFKEKKNVVIVGYNKKGKSIFRNEIFSLQFPGVDPGIGWTMTGPALLVAAHHPYVEYFTDGPLQVDVGHSMQPATQAKVDKFGAAIKRDFRKKGSRFGCGTDVVSCGAGQWSCYLTRGQQKDVCLAAAASCAAAWDSCEVTKKLVDVFDWIVEASQQASEMCQETPALCSGT